MGRPLTRTSWTAADDDELREMVTDGSTDAEIAFCMGRTRQAVKSRRKYLRTRPRRDNVGKAAWNDCQFLLKGGEGRPPNVEVRERVLVLVERLVGRAPAIARELGTGRRTVRRLLQRMALDQLVRYVRLGPRRGKWEVLKHSSKDD